MAISIADLGKRQGSRRARKRFLTALLPLICFPLVLESRASAQVIVAPGGRTLFNQATLLRVTTQVEHLSLRSGSGSIEVDRYVPSLAVAYGFRPKWTLIVAQPYVVAETSAQVGGSTQARSVNGIGDAQVFVQYDGLYSRNSPGGLTRLSGVFGLELPTGVRRTSPRALAYTGGLIFEKVIKLKYAFSSDFQYTATTENAQGTRVGNLARFDITGAYFLLPRKKPAEEAGGGHKFYDRVFHNGTYLILELNGATRAHSEQSGVEIPATGGTTLAVSPGIQYFANQKLILEFSAPIPAVNALRGAQPAPESTFVFGFRYLF